MNEENESYKNADYLYFEPEETAGGLEMDLEEDVRNRFVGLVQDRYANAEQARDFDEHRWLNAYHNFRGIYNKNVRFRESEKSKVFVKVTKTKVLAANSSSSADSEMAKLSGEGADVFFINWSRNGSVLTTATKLTKAEKSIKLIGIRPDQYFIATKDAQKFLIGYVNQRFDSAITDLFSATVSGRSITEEVDAVNGVFGRNYTLANRGIDLIATTANSASKSAVTRAKSEIISEKIAISN